MTPQGTLASERRLEASIMTDIQETLLRTHERAKAFVLAFKRPSGDLDIYELPITPAQMEFLGEFVDVIGKSLQSQFPQPSEQALNNGVEPRYEQIELYPFVELSWLQRAHGKLRGQHSKVPAIPIGFTVIVWTTEAYEASWNAHDEAVLANQVLHDLYGTNITQRTSPDDIQRTETTYTKYVLSLTPAI